MENNTLDSNKTFPLSFIQIHPMTPTEEDTYINNIISNKNRFSVYQKHNYHVFLPKNFEEKIKRENLWYENLHFIDRNESQYQIALQKIKKTIPAIHNATTIMTQLKKDWGFLVLSSYIINLTQFGVGGTYQIKNEDKQRIGTMTTNINYLISQEKSSQNLAATPIHEMVHMGIEEHIVLKYRLTHAEKEQLVDAILVSKFKEILPNYQPQSFKNTFFDFIIKNIDEKDFLNKIKDYKKLNPSS